MSGLIKTIFNKETIQFLSQKEVVAMAGFLIGFTHHVRFNKRTMNAPLSTILVGSWYGSWCAIGAALLRRFVVPDKIVFLIPVICGVSIIVNQFRQTDDKSNN